MHSFISLIYFVVAVLFILGLKKMSHPKTARRGIIFAGIGMAIAVLITFLEPNISGSTNYLLMLIAIVLGGGIAWISGKKVAMTDMPQMIAIYNGMGGGAAAAIACAELLRSQHFSAVVIILALLGAFIGTVSFSGSMIAFAKLQGWMKKIISFNNHHWINIGLSGACGLIGIILIFVPTSHFLLGLFIILLLVLGVLITTPIGGANMPVVISLFNAMTGLAVAFEGFVLNNAAMIIAGTVVGASGSLLTQLMAKAMNQRLINILFKAHVSDHGDTPDDIEGSLKPIEASDAAVMLGYAKNVIIIPGYGLAVAQAQHKIWELTELLEERSVNVKFAIHPVAGRMPGHMNVLLAEAGVPYDKIYDMEDVNQDFANADVAVIIGANDVVNPIARTDPNSPIYGMPILNADKAKNVIVIKRGQGKGFSGVENNLFYMDHTRMLYGDGQKVASELIQFIKEV